MRRIIHLPAGGVQFKRAVWLHLAGQIDHILLRNNGLRREIRIGNGEEIASIRIARALFKLDSRARRLRAPAQ